MFLEDIVVLGVPGIELRSLWMETGPLLSKGPVCSLLVGDRLATALDERLAVGVTDAAWG